MSVNTLSEIGIFAAAAETENFSLAARGLGMTPAGVSRAIGRLERAVGVELFTRSTRVVRLTDDGRLYYERCADAIAQLRAAADEISGRQAEPHGRLRISVPTTYGHYKLIPALPAFAKRYPGVTLEVSVSNRNADLIEEGFDAAIRLGELPDSRLIARKLEDASLGLFASPSYLKANGTPQTLEELARHDCISFTLPSTGRPIPWPLRSNGEDIDWPAKGRAQFEDDVLGCVSYAAGGGGICQIYHFIAAKAVERGELVEIMQAFGGRARAFSLIYPKQKHQSAKLRAFSAFLGQTFDRR
jgi:DNA-binding transcriptional LysR family regulator